MGAAYLPGMALEPFEQLAADAQAMLARMGDRISDCREQGQHPRWRPASVQDVRDLADLVARLADGLQHAQPALRLGCAQKLFGDQRCDRPSGHEGEHRSYSSAMSWGPADD